MNYLIVFFAALTVLLVASIGGYVAAYKNAKGRIEE
jgi:hypothetical protein